MPIHEPLPGIILNQRYLLLKELGRGAMGVVFKASDPVLNREVAVKILTSKSKTSVDTQRFRQEAQAVANFNHPNIVAVYDFGEQDQTPFIVMELVKGGSLAEQMPLSFERAVPIVFEVCQALDHAHQRGVIHRDIKPENILLSDPDGSAKLVDFSIAHIQASQLTLEGELMGTLGYMAPEQISGGKVDPRTDLYAIGILLYEVATGSHPFNSTEPYQLLHHHLHTPVPPPNEKNPDLLPQLNNLILRLLQKAPEDRPASIVEVLNVLRTVEIADGQSTFNRSTIQKSYITQETITIPGSIFLLKPEDYEFLDPIQLSLIHQYPEEIRFDLDELKLLFASALHANLELDYWLGRAHSETDAIQTLSGMYEEHPAAEFRMRLVETISHIGDDAAADALVRIAANDESHLVRSRAAVLCAKRGRTDEIVAYLRADIEKSNDPTALAAYVAIADEVGLPKVRLGIQNFSFLLLLLQRRWDADKTRIKNTAWRGATGAGLFAIPAGLARPVIAWLTNPGQFQSSVEALGLTVWTILGAVVMLVIGSAQAYLSTLLVGVSDMISDSRTTRFTAGAIAGILHTAYLILFTALDLFTELPERGGAYVLIYLVTGLLYGSLMTLAIPKNLDWPLRSSLMKRAAIGALFLAFITAFSTYLVYSGTFLEEAIKRVLFNVLIMLGLGFSLSLPAKKTS